MKKFYKYLYICGLALSCSLSHATTTAETGRIFVQHQGIIAQSYAPADMAKAIEAATEGDTLLLANGTYPSRFTINKSISIIGADASYINCQGNADCITLKSATPDTLKVNLENLNATSNNGLRIEVYNALENGTYYSLAHPIKLSLYKSRILEVRTSEGNMAGVNSHFNRCLVTYQTGLRHPAQANFANTEIMNLGECDNIHANHCYIKSIRSIDNSLIINSIIEDISSRDYDNNKGTSSTVIANSLYHTTDQVYALQNSYASKDALLGTTFPFTCKYTRDQLASNNYLGTDGTVVGIFGGSTPSNITDAASLIAPTNRPQITNQSVDWDESKTKVKVNAKVTAK